MQTTNSLENEIAQVNRFMSKRARNVVAVMPVDAIVACCKAKILNWNQSTGDFAWVD